MDNNDKTEKAAVLVLVSDNELCVAALAAGVLFGAGYLIGKERQRRFVEKHMPHLLKKD